MSKTFCVYETYKIDEPHKNYIGKTYLQRIEEGYMGSGDSITHAFNKYGKEAFSFYILKEFDNEDAAYEYEASLEPNINGYYNIAIGGRGGMAGLVRSNETKRRMSEGKKGHQAGMAGKNHSAETRKAMSDAKKGQRHSVETREKISRALSGRPSSFEGKHHTTETKKKIGDKARGRMKGERSFNWCGISTEDMIDKVLECQSVVKAAKVFGIDKSTIQLRLKDYGYNVVYDGSKHSPKVKIKDIVKRING